ncbi:TIGR02301 family protein [Methylocystis parvus]|uniref:TIGR02301 family protein n=1 Tax=Methylocystis parvus TaxID=134 RepID=A0A6B8M463_9HYPH|nr:TIGR02301 family protein [Methylocystis parvus]QGM97145.1 TIGR02301 family protein [Methylocystis parvus]WBJ98950.1 TIGR02301 family protein [Methylocystis parvus OBBP]
MRLRTAGAVALACALSLASPVAAQGILDLFGPDRPARAPRPARDVPRAEKKKPEAKKKRERANAPAEAAKADAKGAAGSETPAPPYEAQLVRLSEIIGALAYLREICGEKDAEDWRGKMSALLDAEAPSGPRRDKYVAAFNRGFRGYELTYRACTENAKAATARYLEEAAKISRDVTYRFGSP